MRNSRQLHLWFQLSCSSIFRSHFSISDGCSICTTFSQLTIHSSIFTVSVATMITLFIEPGRQRCSSTQPFRLMKTTLNSVFIVLGCTGNAYRVSLFDDSITCNCPNLNHACKHVIFLLSSAGLSLRRQLTFSPTDLLKNCIPTNQTPSSRMHSSMTTQTCCVLHTFIPTVTFATTSHPGRC